MVNLARVHSLIGTSATLKVYRDTVLPVTLDTRGRTNLAEGWIDSPSRPLGISKKEALSHVRHIILEKPNKTMAELLLKVDFKNLGKVEIAGSYLKDLLIQAHCMKAYVSYADFMLDPNSNHDFLPTYNGWFNTNISLEFPEAKLIKHLCRQAAHVVFRFPHAFTAYTDRRLEGYYYMVGHHLNLRSWCEQWDGIKSPHFVCPEGVDKDGFPTEGIFWDFDIDKDEQHLKDDDIWEEPGGWWLTPDLVSKLSLNLIRMESLQLSIEDSRTSFGGFHAKNTLIHLKKKAIFGYMGIFPDSPEGVPGQTRLPAVRGLAVLAALLRTRIPSRFNVHIVLPNPRKFDCYPHIRLLHPHIRLGAFFNSATQIEIDVICARTRDSFMRNICAGLKLQNATTTEKQADFNLITWSYVTEGSWIKAGEVPVKRNRDGSVLN